MMHLGHQQNDIRIGARDLLMKADIGIYTQNRTFNDLCWFDAFPDTIIDVGGHKETTCKCGSYLCSPSVKMKLW